MQVETIPSYEIDGERKPLVVARLDYKQFAAFEPRFSRLRAWLLKRDRVPTGETPEAAAARDAWVQQQQAEAEACLAFAAEAIPAYVLSWGAQDGASLWAEHQTHLGVWLELLGTVLAATTLSGEKKRAWLLLFDSKPSLAAPESATSGDRPAPIAAPVSAPISADLEPAMASP